MAYVPRILPEEGDCSVLGLVKNGLPGIFGNLTPLDAQNYPTAFSYGVDWAVYQDPVPDGYRISLGFPDSITIGWDLLAGFRLYDVVDGEKVASDQMIGWQYRCSARQHHEVALREWVDYTIKMRLIKYTDGDINNGTVIGSEVEISGSREMKAYSNIVGFNDAFIGFVLHRGTYNEKPFFGVVADVCQFFYLEDGRWERNSSSGGNAGICITEDALGDKVIDPNEKTDPNEVGGPGGGPSHEGGGDGDRDDHIDPVPVPPLPGLSATDAGFVTLYNPSLAQIQAIGDEIYTDTVWEIIKNFFKSPDEYIVGLGIIPVQPTVGASKHPKCGIFTFDTAMPVVISEYVEIDCGTIPITEFYGSAFDYSGMTSIQIYLPYIGFRDIDVDGAMDHTLGVIYHVDVYNGNCVAFVTIDGNVHYTFSGNCMQQVPTASQSFDNSISNGIALAAAVVGAVATGGASAAEEAATGGAEMLAAGGEAAASSSAIASASNNAVIGSSMVNVMNSKPNVTRSGALGSSSGLMGIQYPYIVRKIPRQSWPDRYNEFAGYPCNMTVTIGSLSGFFVVDSINLSGVPAMDIEIAEIMAYLKGGAIV